MESKCSVMINKRRKDMLFENSKYVRGLFSTESLSCPIPENRKWSIVGGIQWDNGYGRCRKNL